MRADRQPAGRGRDGREWRAPDGNLNLSILLRPAASGAVAPARWALAPAVAVHAAISALQPAPSGLTLKWPNDVLLSGAKLAGILVDSALTPDGAPDWVVIGIGLNIAEAPALPDRPATCLAAHGITATAAALARDIAQRLDDWTARSLPDIIAAWLERAHPRGTRLRVRQNGQELDGIFDGLNADGSLRLQGRPAVASAEILVAGEARA